MAVRLEEPALRIMTLLEATKDPQVPTRIIEAMQHRPLAEIAAEPWVTAPLGPVLERHRAAIDVVRRLARVEGGVVFVDLADSGIEGANKFITYDLFPQAAYTVVVTRDPKRAKVSVGLEPLGAPGATPRHLEAVRAVRRRRSPRRRRGLPRAGPASTTRRADRP